MFKKTTKKIYNSQIVHWHSHLDFMILNLVLLLEGRSSFRECPLQFENQTHTQSRMSGEIKYVVRIKV